MDIKRYRNLVPNFLTAEECAGFINFAESQGFEGATINHSENGVTVDETIRNNDRHVWQSKDLASQFWSLIKEHAIDEIDGYKAIGLNERFRIYRYEDGQEFKVHNDGSFVRNEDEHSKLTVLIYLNEQFDGGETEFVMPHEIITPKSGDLLLFTHKQLHKGNPVTSGVKYVLRTDVMYKK